RGRHQLDPARIRNVLPVAVAECTLERVEQVEAGLEARALDAHERFQRTRVDQVLGRLESHLAQPSGRLRPDVAHLERRRRAHVTSDSTYTRAISSSPSWSSTSKRPATGLSMS